VNFSVREATNEGPTSDGDDAHPDHFEDTWLSQFWDLLDPDVSSDAAICDVEQLEGSAVARKLKVKNRKCKRKRQITPLARGFELDIQ
jgi:hypothetical protein